MFKVQIDAVAGQTGDIIAQRKDGSRAVLWSDDTITWFPPTQISDLEKHGMVKEV